MQQDDNNIREQEEQIARQKMLDLIERCPRLHKDEKSRKLVMRAFDMANSAHRGMRRKSGELYIFHPVAVSAIAAEEIGMGSQSVAAALLHDVVEDTSITLTDIEAIFGPAVASLVDGLTKLKIVFDQYSSKQAENFRKLLVSMIEDVRVILLKLSDRLHNMRTLDSMPEHKRYRIAAETLYVYAPIAHRLGLFAVKTELEDLSLKYEHPKVYESLVEKLKGKEDDYRSIIGSVEGPVRERLDKKNYTYTIKARNKSIFSIWRKMQSKNIPFEEVYDILAMRIVFEPHEDSNEKAQCWDIYSDVTDIFMPNPDRLRDWISTPKANGYEALHTTVMSPTGHWVEVQIRSKRMDEIAERGYAAHWKYKDGKDSVIDKWIENIREMLENANTDSMDFLDTFKLNLFTQEIMVFTPKGDMKVMPADSTVLDFAFEIHSKIGFQCIGAKVNYKLVPITHILKSGDQVEILTSEKQEPKYEWLNSVVTAKARSHLRNHFRAERKELEADGETVLNLELSKYKLAVNNRILRKMLHSYHVNTKEELYYQIAKGIIKLDGLEKVLLQRSDNKWIRIWKVTLGKITKSDDATEDSDLADDSADDSAALEKPSRPKLPKNRSVILKDDTEESNYKIAPCCNPIPGDEVVGYVDMDNTIMVHRRNCPEAMKLMSARGDRIVTAQWQSHKVLSFLTIIEITGLDRQGIVSEITQMISMEQNLKMRSVHFEAHDSLFVGLIYLYIYDVADLETLMERITKIKGVDKVFRREKTTDGRVIR